MYWRKTSSGSSPTRSARRFAAALISPELVSASIRASIASSDRVRLDDLVAEQLRGRDAGLELAPGEDRLARQAVADRARHAQRGGAGDDPLLARRQEEPAAAGGDHVVHDVEQLAGAADRVGLGRRDPELLGGLLRRARAVLGRAQPAVDLVDVAEVAGDEEDERELAEVEPGQVEARAEDPRSRVAGVLDHAAAHHSDLDLGIEQDQVDGALGRPQRRVVLGVQVARVADLEVPDVPLAPHMRPFRGRRRRWRGSRRSARAPRRWGGASPRRDASRRAARRARGRGRGPARSRGPACRRACARPRRPSRRGSGPAPGSARRPPRAAPRRGAPFDMPSVSSS